MHSNWRDCKAWQQENLSLSTTSNEVCKLYDAALTQIVAFQENETLGGLNGTFTKMLEADPNFVLGRALRAFYLESGSIWTNADYKREIFEIEELTNRVQITKREKNFVNAMKQMAEGQHLKGAEILENILVEHPTDLWALKIAQFTYIYHGKQKEIRDSVARVLPMWKSSIPLYGYVQGMYAFGLIECGNYAQAEQEALKGLDINRNDIWSAHAVCHAYEMTSQTELGINFASKYGGEWKENNLLACHAFWHSGLFHIDNGDFDSALAVYDEEIMTRVLQKPTNVFKISDAASFLRRLEFEGVKVGSRWTELYELCLPFIEVENSPFYDAHIFWTCLKAKESNSARKINDFTKNLLNSFYPDSYPSIYGFVHDTGLSLFDAMEAFEDGNYEKTVELLYPIRYEIVKLGGSDAQRDIFQLFLIHAAIKSPNPFHAKLARSLLYERKVNKGDSPLTQRLLAQVLSKHQE